MVFFLCLFLRNMKSSFKAILWIYYLAITVVTIYYLQTISDQNEHNYKYIYGVLTVLPFFVLQLVWIAKLKRQLKKYHKKIHDELLQKSKGGNLNVGMLFDQDFPIKEIKNKETVTGVKNTKTIIVISMISCVTFLILLFIY